jgi:hypothetical protein
MTIALIILIWVLIGFFTCVSLIYRDGILCSEDIPWIVLSALLGPFLLWIVIIPALINKWTKPNRILWSRKK